MKELFSDVSKLTFMGVMLGLTVIFVFATAIPGPVASLAVVFFLPTIVTGIVLGPKAGGLMGLAAGIITLIRALVLPLSAFDYFFINPLVSVLPRIFIGIAAFWIYYLLKEKIGLPVGLAASFGGAAGAITNTILVVGMLYLVNGQVMVETMGGATFFVALAAIFASNGIIEVISAMILTPMVVGVFYRYQQTKLVRE
jgi:uncharacterized membrane protein